MLHPPFEATNEGARRLRELLLTYSIATLAAAVRCAERTMRGYASERRRPSPKMRRRLEEMLGLPAPTWTQAPTFTVDAYEEGEPVTTRMVAAAAE